MDIPDDLLMTTMTTASAWALQARHNQILTAQFNVNVQVRAQQACTLISSRNATADLAPFLAR
jgi:hypothetical protein